MPISMKSILLLLLVPSSLWATNYYVDQTAGNDANDGSIGSPWKNCPGMAGTAVYTGGGSLSSGDVVYIDRSDSWSVSDGSSPGLELVGGVHYIGDEWDPEGGGPDKAIILGEGRCEAGVVRIFEDHASIETIFEGFEINGGGFIHSGFDINHRFWTTGITGATKRLLDLYVHNCDSDESGGDFRYGIIVSDNSSDASGVVSNVEIINCEVVDVGRDFICLYPGNTGRVTDCLVRGCTSYGPQNDGAYTQGHGVLVKGDVQDSIVEYNNIYDKHGSAVFINGPESGGGPGPTNLIVRHNICDVESGSPESTNGTIRFYGTGTKSADVYGNIILPTTGSNLEGISLDGNTGSLTCNIYNNTLYSTDIDLAGFTCTVRNNISDSIINTGASTLSNNITSSPSFKDTGNLPGNAVGNGFTGTYPNLVPVSDGLESRSYASLDLGFDLGTSFNTSINSVTRPVGRFDIGAYDNDSKVAYITASSADLVAFEAEVDSRNEDDWVAWVDEGDTATWTSGLTIDCGQTISIRGAGNRGNAPNFGAGATAPEITWNGSFTGISFTCTSGKTIWIDNLIFKHSGAQQTNGFAMSGHGINSWRISYISFDNVSADRNIVFIGENQTGSGAGPWGVCDHTYMFQTDFENGVYTYHATNHDQWDTDMTWGTNETVMFEDCTFENTSGSILDGAPALDASYAGARYAARYTTFHNWFCVLHGADSAPTSTLQVEFLHNTFLNDSDSNNDYFIYHRGGSGFYWDNTFTCDGVDTEANSAVKLRNDASGDFQMTGSGTISGVETINDANGEVGVYFKDNTLENINGADTYPLQVSAFNAPATVLPVENTHFFLDEIPQNEGTGTGYVELEYPHPLIEATEGIIEAPTNLPLIRTKATIRKATLLQ